VLGAWYFNDAHKHTTFLKSCHGNTINQYQFGPDRILCCVEDLPNPIPPWLATGLLFEKIRLEVRAGMIPVHDF